MTVDAMVLYPGAGGDASHHTLVALEDSLGSVEVTRRDFPYREQGRKAPDRAPKLIEAITAHVRELTAESGHDSSSMVLGGRSMGGRMASLAVARGLPAAGLVLLSYPLHPQGKPDRLRTEHFGDLDLPVLFISGTRDPFGTPEEFAQHICAIPGRVTMVWLEGQRHDPKGCDDQIVDAVSTWLGRLPVT